MTEKPPTMPALSVRQPWAHLILCGTKRVENRSWGTSYRGPLAMHASATWDDSYTPEELAGLGIPRDLPTSAVLGVVQLIGGHRCPAGRVCSPWAEPGQYHWQLDHPRVLAEPLPCGGALGLWPVPAHIDQALRTL